MCNQRKYRLLVLCAICVGIAMFGVGCSGGSSGSASGKTYPGVPEDQIIAAARAGDAAAVKSLLAGDAGLANSWNENSTTSVLHVAAQGSSGEIVSLLLEKGADPEAKDSDGNTPLGVARESRSPDAVIKPLVEAAQKASAGGAAPAAPAQ